MNKTLSVAVLLLAVFAFTSSSKSIGAVPSSPPAPVIVARGVLTHQTEAFSSTIYTPPQDGLYRLSAYATMTTADPNSESSWSYGFSWTDITGQTQEAFEVLSGAGDQLGQFTTFTNEPNAVFGGGFTRTVQVNAGTPIMHSTFQSGPPDHSAYAVYFTLERIE